METCMIRIANGHDLETSFSSAYECPKKAGSAILPPHRQIVFHLLLPAQTAPLFSTKILKNPLTLSSIPPILHLFYSGFLLPLLEVLLHFLMSLFPTLALFTHSLSPEAIQERTGWNYLPSSIL